MDWSPDSRLWAVGNENGEVAIYNTRGRLYSVMQDRTSVNSLAWSPDGRILAGAKTLWSAGGISLGSFNASTEHVSSVSWSPDGTLLASGGNVGVVPFMDIWW